MLTRPRWLLRLEGAAILGLTLHFYHLNHYSWWLFAILFLSPDLFMLGYLKDANWGATMYNFVHTVTGPLLLLALAFLLPLSACIAYALIWLGHIGFDRMLGFGLKYPTVFKDTHLQHV